MKPLGVIGGISSESNTLYYQIITVDSSYVYYVSSVLKMRFIRSRNTKYELKNKLGKT